MQRLSVVIVPIPSDTAMSPRTPTLNATLSTAARLLAGPRRHVVASFASNGSGGTLSGRYLAAWAAAPCSTTVEETIRWMAEHPESTNGVGHRR
jgi:hypothetical protein